MQNDARICLRVPSEVKAAVQQAASADHRRSTSSMVVRILREWLERNAQNAAAMNEQKGRA